MRYEFTEGMKHETGQKQILIGTIKRDEIMNNTLLESKKGEIKTVDEWQAECVAFYSSIKMDNHIVTDQWERYSRILGLQPVGTERTWSGRKPVGKLYEGKTSVDLSD